MDECGSVPQQNYGEFSEWLHRQVGNQHIPISGSLEVTLRCNLRCQFCQNWEISCVEIPAPGHGSRQLEPTKAIEMATKMIDYETGTYRLASYRKKPAIPAAA